jgi:hypothetical protein
MPVNPVALSYDNVLGVNPALIQSPGVAGALASTGGQDIEAVSQFIRAKRRVDALNSMPPEQQYYYWQRMSKADQNAAVAAGYILPLDQHEFGGPNALEKGVGKVFGLFGKITPDQIEDPLKKVVTTYNDFVENTVQRGLRTAIIGAEAVDSGDFESLITPSDWKNWWDEADDSNAPVNRRAEQHARERFGNSVIDLVRYEQRNPGGLREKWADLIRNGDDDQAARLDSLMRSAEFQDAFEEMERARLSLGREFAQLIPDWMPGHDQIHTIVSGTVDAAWRLRTDPLNVGMQKGRQWRQEPYVIPAVDEAAALRKLDQAFTGSGAASNNVRRYFDGVGERMQTIRDNPHTEAAAKALDDLRTKYTATWHLHEQMMKYGVRDAATAREFFDTEAGFRAILSGRRAGTRGLIPYRTALQERVSALKPGSVIDFLESGDKLTRDSIQQAAGQVGHLTTTPVKRSDFKHIDDEVGTQRDAAGKNAGDRAYEAAKAEQEAFVKQTGKQLDAWRRSWRGRAATALRRASSQTVKVDDHGNLDLLADGATEQVVRLARYYGPKYWADQIGATFSATDDIVLRKNIVKGLLETMAEASGVTKTIEGRQWFDEFVKKMDDAATGDYSVTDVGKLSDGRRSGWLLEHARPTVPIPALKDWHAQSAKVSLVDGSLGVVNHRMVDRFMDNVWRPAMLLRPATAIRNAIDENVITVLRTGAHRWADQRAELRVANQKAWQARQSAKQEARDASATFASLEKSIADEFGSVQGLLAKADELEAAAARIRKSNKGGRRKAGDPVASATATKLESDSLFAEAKKLRARERELVRARERAQFLESKFEGTPNSVDPTAGRLFRGYQKSAMFLMDQVEKLAPASPAIPALRSAVAGDSVHNFYRAHVYGKMSAAWLGKAKAEELAYIDDLIGDDLFREALNRDMVGTASDSLSETTRAMDAYVDRPGRKGRMQWITTNPSRMGVQDDFGVRAWSQMLNKFGDDQLALTAMLYVDDTTRAMQEMLRVLKENPEYDRKLIAVRDKGHEKFAAEALAEVRTYLSDANGNLHTDLVRDMVLRGDDGVLRLNRDAFTPEKLGEIPPELRPSEVVGRQGILIEENATLADLVQRGFKFFGEMTAFLSRHPQMVDEYVQMRTQLKPWQERQARVMAERFEAELDMSPEAAQARAAELAKDQAHRAAVQEATERTILYIDNPAIRSQAAVLFRTIGPFYRAQEEFFRRWARAMKYSPEMFARANLYFDGLQNSGFVYTTDDGTLMFGYPGSDYLQRAMVEVGDRLGLPVSFLPVPSVMTGQVDMLAPGFQTEQWTKPFNGPILTVPVATWESLGMPGGTKTLEFQRFMFGDVAAGQNPFMNFIPSVIRPAVDSYVRRDQVMFAAKKQAIAYLQANGMGLPENPSPKERQEFLERVSRHARGLVWTKAILAPNLPASPRAGNAAAPTTTEADIASQEAGMRYVSSLYYKLIEEVGHEDAYGYWVKHHPDELPFIEGATEGDSFAYLPMTTRAKNFLEDNQSFVKRYNLAAPFLVPQEKGDTDMDAWQMAMDLGIRRYKSVDEYLDDVLVAKGLEFYYDQQDQYYTMLDEARNAGDTAAASRIRTAWDAWKNQYLPMNPLVQREIDEGMDRAQRRENTLTQVREMLNDPDLPYSPSLGKIRELVVGYDQMNAMLGNFPGRDDASNLQRKQIREQFNSWAKSFTADDEGAAMLYNRVLRNLVD